MGDKQAIYAKEKQVIDKKSYLPYDLIIHEIFMRLPVKSILRFKSVSKQWYSTLSSSKFATFHLMKSPFSHPSAPVNTLFIENWKKFYLFSYDNDQNPCNLEDNLVKLDVDFGVNDYLKLTGCCNGLVCLSKPFSEYFVLWNPATRKLHKYPSDGYLKGIHDNVDRPFVASGFGYASSDDDYKYVRILGWGRKKLSNIAHIFSLRESKWRKIEFEHHAVFPYGKSVLLDENLYWVSYSKLGSVIVCFDLGLEKFDIIKLNSAAFSYLGVMGACLIESKYDGTDGGEKLKKIQMLGSTTTIEKSIDLPKGIILDIESQMIGYTRTGSFFMTGTSNDQLGNIMLLLVDSSMKPMQCATLLNVHEPINIARYVPSLVSPFPIEEVSES
ncbi:F-box protein CPR1-like [Silene latifolia]|uniref:F-box protein CPR1-like n=1 Tax=Silene latifolia TaxID=37657 RepID=UPI003D76C033